jgi:hypothetical protein
LLKKINGFTLEKVEDRARNGWFLSLMGILPSSSSFPNQYREKITLPFD